MEDGNFAKFISTTNDEVLTNYGTTREELLAIYNMLTGENLAFAEGFTDEQLRDIYGESYDMITTPLVDAEGRLIGVDGVFPNLMEGMQRLINTFSDPSNAEQVKKWTNELNVPAEELLDNFAKTFEGLNVEVDELGNIFSVDSAGNRNTLGNIKQFADGMIIPLNEAKDEIIKSGEELDLRYSEELDALFDPNGNIVMNVGEMAKKLILSNGGMREGVLEEIGKMVEQGTFDFQKLNTEGTESFEELEKSGTDALDGLFKKGTQVSKDGTVDISNATGEMVEVMDKDFKSLNTKVDTNLGNLTTLISSHLSEYLTDFKDTWQKDVPNAIQDAFNKTNNGVQGIRDRMKTELKGLLQDEEGLKNIDEKIGDLFKGVGQKIIDKITEAPVNLKSVGTEIKKSIIKELDSLSTELATKIKEEIAEAERAAGKKSLMSAFQSRLVSNYDASKFVPQTISLDTFSLPSPSLPYLPAVNSNVGLETGISELIQEVKQLRAENNQLKVYLDSGQLVGAISNEVDTNLQKNANLSRRGVNPPAFR